MNFFSQSGPEVVYKTEEPAFCQSDGCKVNPRLRKYIMRGEPCEYDTRLRNSFESRTKESNVKVILMIVGFILLALKVILSVLNDTLKDPLILWLISLQAFLRILFTALIGTESICLHSILQKKEIFSASDTKFAVF